MTKQVKKAVRPSGAAEILDIDVEKIYQLIATGQLEAIDVSGPGPRPRWRILLADLDRFIERRRKGKPTPTVKKRRPRTAKKYF